MRIITRILVAKGAFSVLVLFAGTFLLGKDEPIQNPTYWYLNKLLNYIIIDHTKFTYAKNDTISIVPAQKVFQMNHFSNILKPKINYYKKNPEDRPKDFVAIDNWELQFSSWLMPSEKWEQIYNFEWKGVGFPVIWKKETNNKKQICALVFSEGFLPYKGKNLLLKSISESDFEELKEYSEKWLESKDTKEDMISLLKKGNKNEKIFAIRMLVQKNAKELIPLLSEYITNNALRPTCLWALDKIRDKKSIPLLIKAFYLTNTVHGAKSDYNSVAIINAMCKIGGKEVDKELSDWLNDPDISYRTYRNVLTGIEIANYKSAQKILILLLKNRKDEQGKKNIVNLLEKLSYIPPGTFFKTAKSVAGVEAFVMLPKKRYKRNEPVVVKIKILNNSSSNISWRIIPSKDISIFYSDKNKAEKKVPSLLEKHFHAIRPASSGWGDIKILARKEYLQKINLSKFFDLTLASNYLISCEFNYYQTSKRNQMKVLKVKIPITIK